MTDWKNDDYPAGTLVNVIGLDREPWGQGVLLKPFHNPSEDEFSDEPDIIVPLDDADAAAEALMEALPADFMDDMPEIRLTEVLPACPHPIGHVVRGCDCWWIPVEEIQQGG